MCPLQDMLARTQALEDLLLQLHAEKNELEAESARMPSHTTGRTMQVGGRGSGWAGGARARQYCFWCSTCQVLGKGRNYVGW